MFFFAYSSIVSDVAFIRTGVVLANLFITAWSIFGVPTWPRIWRSELAEVHVDQILWCVFHIVFNGIPMFRQFYFDDSKAKFKVGKEYEALAESVWREWFRRSGIPRTDFKAIVEAGDVIRLPPGEKL